MNRFSQTGSRGLPNFIKNACRLLRLMATRTHGHIIILYYTQRYTVLIAHKNPLSVQKSVVYLSRGQINTLFKRFLKAGIMVYFLQAILHFLQAFQNASQSKFLITFDLIYIAEDEDASLRQDELSNVKTKTEILYPRKRLRGAYCTV